MRLRKRSQLRCVSKDGGSRHHKLSLVSHSAATCFVWLFLAADRTFRVAGGGEREGGGVKRKAEPVNWEGTYGQLHVWVTRKVERVQDSGTIHYTGLDKDFSQKKSPLALRTFTTITPATQHSRQCISRCLKPEAATVLEIPYVGLPGPSRPIWTDLKAALFGWRPPRMEMWVQNRSTMGDLGNPTEG